MLAIRSMISSLAVGDLINAMETRFEIADSRALSRGPRGKGKGVGYRSVENDL